MFNIGDRVISSFTGAGTVVEVDDEFLRVLFDGSLGLRLWSRSKLTLIDNTPTVRKGIKTNTPCRSKCWEAYEQLCRCSCAGKNHGIAFDNGRLLEYHELLLGEPNSDTDSN